MAVTYDRALLHYPKHYDPQRRAQRESRRKSPIFAAQNQLKKYVDWSTDQDIRKRSQVLPYSIEIFLPCILFQGYMYEAMVENDGKVKLKRKKHIVLETLFRSPYSVYEKNLLIDVISDKPFGENCFKDYQELIRGDVRLLEEVVSQNSEEISRRISGTLELIESTQRTR